MLQLSNPYWTAKERRVVTFMRVSFLVELCLSILFLLVCLGTIPLLDTSILENVVILPILLAATNMILLICSLSKGDHINGELNAIFAPSILSFIIIEHTSFSKYLNRLCRERIDAWQEQELIELSNYLNMLEYEQKRSKKILTFVRTYLDWHTISLHINGKGKPYRKQSSVEARTNSKTDATLYDFYVGPTINRFQFTEEVDYEILENRMKELEKLEFYTQAYLILPKEKRRNREHPLTLRIAFYSEFLNELLHQIEVRHITPDNAPKRITPRLLENIDNVELKLRDTYRDYI